jgi:PucR family transcriptional regulator, purine catabolism regulatory protein
MPLVTVSEVLRLALPPATEVVAGAAGLSNAATWARLLRARPASLGRIEQGEIWILSAAALHLVGDPRSVARMIRDMGQAGVVAFVTTELLGPEARAEANEANTPVLRVPTDTPLGEVEKAIVSVLVDRDRAIGQRVQEVYERLLSTLVVEERGLELISSIVAEVTDKAVYLLDEHFQPTVQTGGGERAAEALADVRRRHWEGLLGNVSERLIVVRTVGVGEPTAVALRPLTLRGAIEGYLALLGPADDFVDFDHQVADRAASVLAIELAKQSAVVEARLRVQGDFLTDLLDNPAPPADALIERARRLGYDLSRPHLVFVLRPRDGEAANGTGVRGRQRFVDATRRRLVLSDVTTLLRERDGSIQVLMPCPPDVEPTDADAGVAWVERLRSSLEESLQPDSLSVVAGVGRTPGRETTAYAAMREATRAADIAASMSADSPASLHFARLGALRLIFHLADNPELRAFQRDVLGPLETSDAARRSEFVRTLDAFLRAGGNHMRAARDLNVHRNTLIYRLERIQELLGGSNLEHPETRLNLQLALKIRAALGGSTPA